MAELSMQGRLSQRQKQVQQQRMSQQQIMSLNLLAMSSLDLREAISRERDRNPALVIGDDRLENGVGSARTTSSADRRFSDNTRFGVAGMAGAAASDAFQAALESAQDKRESLVEHLEHQFNATPHSPDEEALGLALIHNLDPNGFHILAPLSLLDKKRPAQNEALLQKCMEEIRALDPVGTCVSGTEESLFVQAKLSGRAPEAALFLLDGHLPFLDPPQGEKILKKINAFLAERRSLSFLDEKESYWLTRPQSFSLSDVTQALAFIRTLDPFPARNFGSSQAQYVAPDVYVEKIPPVEGEEKLGIVSPPPAADNAGSGGTAAAAGNAGAGSGAPAAAGFFRHSFKISLARGILPSLSVSQDASLVGLKDEQGKDLVRSARAFVESVQFRENTLFRAMVEIVRLQAAFFEQGPRFLAPLRQKDVAELLGVHETTISRMANGKYVQCEWGLFELSYFFSSAVGAGSPSAKKSGEGAGNQSPSPSEAGGLLSKEAAKYQVAEILKAHAADKKPLSDQKISDMLAQRGIKIARRTVAKYRSELNVASSFDR